MTYQHLNNVLVESLLDSIDYVLLDIDGVLWAGETVIPQVPETIQWLKTTARKKVRYMTNNSTMSRKEMMVKFKKHGIKEIREEEIYSSGFAASLTLKKLAQKQGKEKFEGNIFVLGNEGFFEDVEKYLAPGFFAYGRELTIQRHVDPAPGLLDPLNYKPRTVAEAVNSPVLPVPRGRPDLACGRPGVSLEDLNIKAVFIAYDFHLNLTKLGLACVLLSDPAIPFVASNPDPQLPHEHGGKTVLLPGAGTIVQFVQVATGRRPDYLCGKPEVTMMEILFQNEKVEDPKRCLMVGDRLTTDVAFGKQAGTQTLLVLSGCEQESDIKSSGITPDFVAPSLASLMTLSSRNSLSKL
jgi:4-nitrophenyl phosphatase